MTHTLRLTADDHRFRGALLLDGVDISNHVTGIEYRGDVKEPHHQVTLHLLLREGIDVELGAAEVQVDEDTRRILTDLGWTPPAAVAGEEVDDARSRHTC